MTAAVPASTPVAVIIPARIWRAVSAHAADPSRVTLSGVRVEGTGTVVASNGHTLLAWPAAATWEGVGRGLPAAYGVLVPARALKLPARAFAIRIEVGAGDRLDLYALDKAGEVIASAITHGLPVADYPHWRWILSSRWDRAADPDRAGTRAIRLDVEEYADRFALPTGGANDGGRPILHTVADDSAVIVTWEGEPCIGVWMPVRLPDAHRTLPATLPPFLQG